MKFKRASTAVSFGPKGITVRGNCAETTELSINGRMTGSNVQSHRTFSVKSVSNDGGLDLYGNVATVTRWDSHMLRTSHSRAWVCQALVFGVRLLPNPQSRLIRHRLMMWKLWGSSFWCCRLPNAPQVTGGHPAGISPRYHCPVWPSSN